MWSPAEPIPVIDYPGSGLPRIHLLDGPDRTNAANLDHMVMPYIDRMHEHGILLSWGSAKHVGVVLREKQAGLADQIKRAFGHEINSKSHLQVSNILQERNIYTKGISQGIFPSERWCKTDGGKWSTNDEILNLSLAVDPAIKLLIDDRELRTLQANFVTKLPRFINRHTGRVHTTFKLASVSTGRIASEDPPMQTLPSHSEYSALIRSMFVASPGYRLVSVDFSQIEMWLAGVLSQCPKLMAIFRDGLDTHTMTASMMFGIPYDSVERKTHRLYAKTVNFGVLYGMKALALMIRIIVSGGPRKPESECESYIKTWYQIYSAVYHFMCCQWANARRLGYTTDIIGRTRPCPWATCVDTRLQESGYRQAGNAPIQGSGAALTKLAMARQWCELIEPINAIEPDTIRPVLQIHDELVAEVRDWYADEYLSVTLDIMKSVDRGAFGLPIGASGAIGSNLGEIK